MPRSKAIDFSGQTFSVGLDFHKKSISVSVRTSDLEVAHFSQPADVSLLVKHLKTRFPNADFISAYEAGFCGTSHHQTLLNAGFRNLVIHPADLPQTDKQKNTKTDLHDSRAIARYLEKGLLRSIHVLPLEQQERRALYRCREAKSRDVARCTNRLRSFMDYFGIQVPPLFADNQYISSRYLDWLRSLSLSTSQGKETLHHQIDELVYHRKQLLELTKKLRTAVELHYRDSFAALLSVPGIGPITAMALLTETGDLARFKDPDSYASYLGLVPGEQSSGDTVYSKSLQPRCNRHLRPMLIEAAWVAIRRCPVLLAYFKKHARTNNKKAIIKVARKLALIAKAVAINKSPYEPRSGF